MISLAFAVSRRGWAIQQATTNLPTVPIILLATDADWIFEEVDAALADESTTVYRVRAGIDVLQAIKEAHPDLVILDGQIGNMGGVATCMAIRNAESVDEIPITAVLLLLDRVHDVFQARRCDADGWLVKPLDSLRLSAAARATLAGEAYADPNGEAAGQPTDLTI